MSAVNRYLKNPSTDDFGSCGNHLRKSAEIMPLEKDDFCTGGVVFVEHPQCENLPAAFLGVDLGKVRRAEIIRGAHESAGASFLWWAL